MTRYDILCGRKPPEKPRWPDQLDHTLRAWKEHREKLLHEEFLDRANRHFHDHPTMSMQYILDQLLDERRAGR